MRSTAQQQVEHPPRITARTTQTQHSIGTALRELSFMHQHHPTSASKSAE
ncbi:hypothetical protein [Dermatophilus congolensis]|nr:hypothetical protein [Dermatophilus congolensis]MBO3143715.1 hypothetical protein [Dermatophilus congolensis]MBO3152706.1 hypothetical protein [Dermatophilus congolensis]MBO3160284.1 hypothetical protein [Dermatophilus congolensis]MBO3163990.1 hypothetical protein [Dermatophilus congolensis]MBO3177536.1 hypothetical protein [Dermatophilus congolensis]